MKLVVLGASGETGTQIMEQAHVFGHEAVGLVRANSNAPSGRQWHRMSDLLDVQALARELEGADAVFVTLGIRRRARSLFAPLVSPPDVCRTAVAALVPAMRKAGVKRVIYLSAFGVGADWKKLPWWARFIIRSSPTRFSYEDHAAAEALLAGSDLAWTIIRPTMLDEADSGAPAREMRKGDSFMRKVGRKGLAVMMLQTAFNQNSIRQRISVVS